MGAVVAPDPIGLRGTHETSVVWLERDLSRCQRPPDFPTTAVRAWTLPDEERVRAVFASPGDHFVVLTRRTADCCSASKADVIRAYAMDPALLEPTRLLSSDVVPAAKAGPASR